MKASLVIPVLATLIGFGLGWLVKPQGTLPSPASSSSQPPPGPPPPAAKSEDDKPAQAVITQPVRVSKPSDPDPTVAERAEKLSTARHAAKMQRFAEVVGLSKPQQADLKKILAENEKSFVAEESEVPPGPKETLDLLVSGSVALEKSLSSLFTPEQGLAFAQLRKRELDNRIETNAQRELGQLSEMTDLSADQRVKVLDQLRSATTAELGAMPASITLLLDSSVLPLGSQAMSEQAIQTLRQIVETQNLNDPGEVYAKIVEAQRAKLDARLALLKDILTPAQLLQYQSVIAEHQSIHDVMNRSPR